MVVVSAPETADIELHPPNQVRTHNSKLTARRDGGGAIRGYGRAVHGSQLIETLIFLLTHKVSGENKALKVVKTAAEVRGRHTGGC